jgi:signal transduction histidine kinase
VRREGRALGLPRLLVFALLSVLLMATYLLLVGLAEAALGDRGDRAGALVAAGVVAVAAAPLRTRLQRSVDRLAYGDRGDPYAALSELGRRVAGDPGDLLVQVTEAVSSALRTPYVAVVLAGDEAPDAMTDRPGTELLPLTVAGERVGTLVVGGRPDGRPFGRGDHALLLDLSRHIAVAAHSAALSRDLQRSRESLVTAREEERRRIRRDLHDGLGPALAGVALGLDAARNTVARDPEQAAAALAGLKAEVQSSLADVRRLVYDLRPPALDQLGLVGALEEHAARLGERGGPDTRVVAGRLPALPAAVEVAAYRIATEALSNAARHSGARQVRVRVQVEGSQLRVEVRDDGAGVPEPARRRAGVGLAAMAERAAELGGTCTVGPGSPTGTVVTATLPLRGGS